MLRALLAEQGYGHCAIDEAALVTAVQNYNTLDEPFSIALAQRQNAIIEIMVAQDEMSADLHLTGAQGGKTATLGDILQELTKAGVAFGVDDDALRQATEAHAGIHLCIARGREPKNGQNSLFQTLVKDPPNRTPQVDENGLIDYRERGAIHTVQPDTPLMRRIPATLGVEGCSVRGRVLPAHSGRDIPFAAHLAGAQPNPNDPDVLLATVSGQPVQVASGMIVEPILKVAEVNMASGNIHFDGTVHIKGDVLQDLLVKASGDIIVQGMVDGGKLEAGGNITIAGGIISHASVRAGGSVTARFAQGVQIHAGTVIELHDMALDCQLESLNQILIGTQKPGRGRLIGGTTSTMMLLKVPILGSPTSRVTRVALGANPELDAKYAALQECLAKQQLAEENLQKLEKQVSSTGDPTGMLPRIKQSRQHALQEWGKLLTERKELEAQIAAEETARLEIGKAVEGAVDLSFTKHLVRLRSEYGAGVFSHPPDSPVVFTDHKGSPVPVN
ncbi:MAG: FapA family protein [Simplicispira sp.]|nr:FapA family protein [Simplicispira sp.]